MSEFVAVRWPIHRNRVYMMTTYNRNTFYWNEGPSHCDLMTNCIIEKSYGHCHTDEEKDAAWAQFYIDFPPEAKIEVSDGWLSPDGRYFTCFPWEHEALARDICQSFYKRVDNGRWLEEQGWLKVSHVIVGGNGIHPTTQAQLNTLGELFVLAKGDNRPGLVGSINEYLDYVKEYE